MKKVDLLYIIVGIVLVFFPMRCVGAGTDIGTTEVGTTFIQDDPTIESEDPDLTKSETMSNNQYRKKSLSILPQTNEKSVEFNTYILGSILICYSSTLFFTNKKICK